MKKINIYILSVLMVIGSLCNLTASKLLVLNSEEEKENFANDMYAYYKAEATICEIVNYDKSIEKIYRSFIVENIMPDLLWIWSPTNKMIINTTNLAFQFKEMSECQIPEISLFATNVYNQVLKGIQDGLEEARAEIKKAKAEENNSELKTKAGQYTEIMNKLHNGEFGKIIRKIDSLHKSNDDERYEFKKES